MALIATARNSRDNRRPNNSGPAVRNNRDSNRRPPNNRRQRNNTARISRLPTANSIRQATARQTIGSRETNRVWSRAINREFDRLLGQTGGSGFHHPRSQTPIRRELDQINRLRISSDGQLRRYVEVRFGGIEDQLSLIHHNISTLDKELGRHPMKTQFEIATEPLLKAAVSIFASIAICLIAIFSGNGNQGIILGALLSIVALGSLRALGGQSFRSTRNSSGSAPSRANNGSSSTSRSS
jgi:hypothetical protein